MRNSQPTGRTFMNPTCMRFTANCGASWANHDAIGAPAIPNRRKKSEIAGFSSGGMATSVNGKVRAS